MNRASYQTEGKSSSSVAFKGVSGGGCTNSSNKQEGWRWCRRCMTMWFTQYNGSSGVCPSGGGHEQDGSGQYLMVVEGGCDPCDGWRWCNQCMALHRRTLTSKCASGGSHSESGSGAYYVCMGSDHPQSGWSGCNKCGVLWFTGASGGDCAAGGVHEESGRFVVGHY